MYGYHQINVNDMEREGGGQKILDEITNTHAAIYL